MPVKQLKPNTAARRNMSVLRAKELMKKRPEKSLTKGLKRRAGRNTQGKITVRHRGGGAKRLYRLVDFKMTKATKANVIGLEYDPYRSGFIALLEDADGAKRYILAPQGVKAGDTLEFGPDAEIRPGNRLPLRSIPDGTAIYNIELMANAGGKLVRSAGSAAQLLGKEGDLAIIRLPSGEVRRVHAARWASVGSVSNPDHGTLTIGKAGRVRHMGRRPQVRGVAMDPGSHAHGGGEGRTGIGRPHPVTPWGKPALGVKTRRRSYSDKFIVRRRSKKRRG